MSHVTCLIRAEAGPEAGLSQQMHNLSPPTAWFGHFSVCLCSLSASPHILVLFFSHAKYYKCLLHMPQVKFALGTAGSTANVQVWAKVGDMRGKHCSTLQWHMILLLCFDSTWWHAPDVHNDEDLVSCRWSAKPCRSMGTTRRRAW